MALLFENEVCGRCGGTGEYSFNQMDGTMCYGCHGKGAKLTKRGQAAQAYYTAMRQIPAGMLKTGDRFWDSGWRTVISCDLAADERNNYRTHTLDINTPNCIYGGWGLNQMVTVSCSKEQAASYRKLALEHQATLTKAGKPRKR